MTSPAHEHLRVPAIAADADARETVNLPRLWRDLTSGTHKIVEAFFTDERCYMLVSQHEAARPHAIEGRRLTILEAVLGGLLQKNIAIDLALAPSTIALNSRLGLETLGVHCKPSRAHPLLMLAARGARYTPLSQPTWSSFVTPEGLSLGVIGAPRPDRKLQALLPSAELAVIRRLVEGLSYAEIAQCRGTSTRTIANQITAVFRRLRVSGRNELVQRLFFDESVGRPLPRRVTETLVPAPSTKSSWQEARRSA